jgi:enhancing lycopene biosynthesis protein 2
MKGAGATVNSEVSRLLKEVHAAGKPIAAVCIAPALLAAVLGKELSPDVTIGTDAATAAEINKSGAVHHDCPVTEFVVDKKNKIVTSPAYMLATRIAEVDEGISRTVQALVALI